jgi:hypothetical protein
MFCQNCCGGDYVSMPYLVIGLWLLYLATLSVGGMTVSIKIGCTGKWSWCCLWWAHFPSTFLERLGNQQGISVRIEYIGVEILIWEIWHWDGIDWNWQNDRQVRCHRRSWTPRRSERMTVGLTEWLSWEMPWLWICLVWRDMLVHCKLEHATNGRVQLLL